MKRKQAKQIRPMHFNFSVLTAPDATRSSLDPRMFDSLDFPVWNVNELLDISEFVFHY
jgi:hypothetical protein